MKDLLFNMDRCELSLHLLLSLINKKQNSLIDNWIKVVQFARMTNPVITSLLMADISQIILIAECINTVKV